MRRDVYTGWLKLYGEEHRQTILAANNYAHSLVKLERFEEARSLLRKTVPVARRVLGDSHDLTIQMRARCARALYKDTGVTLDDLREAVTMLEDTERVARRVLGGAHPITSGIERQLRASRAALHSSEAPP